MHNVKAPILVSGDVHMAEYLRRDCKQITQLTKMRSLVEVTTSGMTHAWGTKVCIGNDNNKFKKSWVCTSRYLQWMTATAMHIAHIYGDDSFEPTPKLKIFDFQRRWETLAQHSHSHSVGNNNSTTKKVVTISDDDWICLPNQGPMPPTSN
jgi:hypothetical protein